MADNTQNNENKATLGGATKLPRLAAGRGSLAMKLPTLGQQAKAAAPAAKNPVIAPAAPVSEVPAEPAPAPAEPAPAPAAPEAAQAEPAHAAAAPKAPGLPISGSGLPKISRPLMSPLVGDKKKMPAVVPALGSKPSLPVVPANAVAAPAAPVVPAAPAAPVVPAAPAAPAAPVVPAAPAPSLSPAVPSLSPAPSLSSAVPSLSPAPHVPVHAAPAPAGASLSELQDEEEGGATEAIAQPSLEELQKGLAELQGSVGGAASSISSQGDDDELIWEDDDNPEDAGEKTMMLDAPMEDELDINSEKTQINMGAMEFEPLTGKLIVESGKTSQREYILVREKTTIGRHPECNIAISDISMSRHHVEIDKFPEGFRIRDLDSGNGTMLNGYRIRVGQLRNNDTIEIGSIRFRFEQEGGDPDVLWRGEPKVEYHPNQKGTRKSAAADRKPLSNAPQVSADDDALESGPTTATPQPKMEKMESMLERQGGGLAAPAWAAAPPMTSPYMMSLSANALKTVNTPPLWANIVLFAMIGLSVVAISVLLISSISSSHKQRDIEARNAIVKKIEMEINNGINAYASKNLNEARENFNVASELDKDGTLIKDRSLFDFYQKWITQEDDINREITKMRERHGIGNTVSFDDFERDIQYLKQIDSSSIYRQDADSFITRWTKDYYKQLNIETRQLISDNHLDEARALVERLKKLPNSENDVSTLNTHIANKEKAMKK